jgi:hypothetical protein
MSKRQILTLVSLLIAEILLSAPIKAQTGLVDPRKTEYVCVLSRTVKGNDLVLVLPCEAANVRQDNLTDADYAVLEKMQAERILWGVLKASPNPEVEARTTRADFLKFAKEVCSRHPKIALLPLDWKTEQTRMSEITEAGGVPLKTCGTL